jgi:hypothetical protein
MRASLCPRFRLGSLGSMGLERRAVGTETEIVQLFGAMTRNARPDICSKRSATVAKANIANLD